MNLACMGCTRHSTCLLPLVYVPCRLVVRCPATLWSGKSRRHTCGVMRPKKQQTSTDEPEYPFFVYACTPMHASSLPTVLERRFRCRASLVHFHLSPIVLGLLTGRRDGCRTPLAPGWEHRGMASGYGGISRARFRGKVRYQNGEINVVVCIGNSAATAQIRWASRNKSSLRSVYSVFVRSFGCCLVDA